MDLRKMMDEHPIPSITPGTVDLASVAGDEPTKQAGSVLNRLNAALAANNAEMLESCFFPSQAYWKDQLALTYHLRTFATPGVIAANLLETKTLRKVTGEIRVNGKAQFSQDLSTLVSNCLNSGMHVSDREANS
ncbi:hypothetical protein SI65_08711 [Aspergillus cristatus]|uniref:Uncharacterized protein n=1 Tax=Aspergillus cristatus TaxID=573508 RepID=A0A1E3B4Y1_ASPCR|nr:hypothetical protein SI65_08711 [Aspergillus cristatus]